MKNALKWLAVPVLMLAAGIGQADPIMDNALNNYKTGWYSNSNRNSLLTCPQTCKIKVNGVAERERSMSAKNKVTHVCKFTNRKAARPIPGDAFLYGNQFDNFPVCQSADMSGKAQKSRQFYCLCIASSPCAGPDLIVAKIYRPQWDEANNRSIITADIRNIGGSAAALSIARVVDPSAAPSTATANTPALAAGATATVSFYLPYWVHNPDANLEVTADYKGMVEECNEKNNTLNSHEAG